MSENTKLEKFISKKNLKKMLAKAIRESSLVAPVEVHNDVLFQGINDVDEISFNYENCLNSPKDLLLLNDETLFKYNSDNLKLNQLSSSAGELIIFGSRPCDTKAIELLDKFFTREFKDPLYSTKRRHTLIITFACNKLAPGCFCTSTETGPYLKAGFDIQLIDIGTGYILQAQGQKGKKFLKTWASLLNNVSCAQETKKAKLIAGPEASGRKEFDLNRVYNRLAKNKTNKGLWEDLARRCQNCGGCLLVCPSCSCFYVVEKRIDKKQVQRVRSLDTCYYQGFTRMAGGYNPSLPKPAMMQRKFYHKLKQQLDEFKQSGCTGCGRCNEICPGNVNWLATIKKIAARER